MKVEEILAFLLADQMTLTKNYLIEIWKRLGFGPLDYFFPAS